MRKALLILLVSISSICVGQSRIALPTPNKDTLFIINDESGQAMIELWNISSGGYKRPIFVKLSQKEFDRKLFYYINKEKSLKAAM